MKSPYRLAIGTFVALSGAASAQVAPPPGYQLGKMHSGVPGASQEFVIAGTPAACRQARSLHIPKGILVNVNGVWLTPFANASC